MRLYFALQPLLQNVGWRPLPAGRKVQVLLQVGLRHRSVRGRSACASVIDHSRVS